MIEDKEKNNQNIFSVETCLRVATSVMFTQMQAATGFNLFGEKAVAEMFKELKQLEHGPMLEKPVLHALNPDTMAPEEKRKVLNEINLIKEKRDVTIKGRTCADGSKKSVSQRI